MKITFVARKFRNVERNVHCDVLHITPDRVAKLVLDGNGVFAIKANVRGSKIPHQSALECVTVVDSTSHSNPPQKCVYAAEKAAMHW